jgi:predicted PurR-regulated permease PerM
VVLATLLSAVVQGLLAGIGFFFLGFDAVFLLTVVTMLLALVPFVGAAAVWGSCSVWLLLYQERIGAAIALVIYGICVVSMADNIIKPIVLHGQSKLHPLLALLSVLGGVQALGPIGIFVGPMAVALLQALLNILNTELTALSQRTPTLHAPE